MQRRSTKPRQCGECTLCCVVMPVSEIGKKANVRCSHLRSILHAGGGVGCSIYHNRPPGCRRFSCVWLRGADIGRRPDQSHLVVDPSVDFVETSNDDTGERTKILVIQVWIDPAFPLAHRDTDFRKWLRSTGRPALIRSSSNQALFLVYQENKWFEIESKNATGQHTPEEIMEAAREAS